MGTPVIGVTGSIGSGKTTFGSFLAGEEGRHINADLIARKLLKIGNPAYRPVIEEFGTSIIDENGHIEPRKLASRVFSDREKLKKLEAIVHPLVREEVEKIIERADSNFYVIDVPLLFEAGFDKICDYVVVVTASPAVVEKRLAAEGISAGEITRRRQHQWPQQKKADRADLIVENNGSVEELKKAANRLREKVVDRKIVGD
ncbi:MAG: dephospho-CoA kinase [bacterium]